MTTQTSADGQPGDEEEPAPPPTPGISDRSGVTDAVRAQILSSEHWSLLATRSVTWNEIFSRATMFITVLSATVVALALVAQAGGFGVEFRIFALLVLSVALLVGFATFIRLGEANSDDIELVMAMNRVRNGYLELAPELEPYFTTGRYDDHAGILQSYGSGYRLAVGRFIAGTPSLVGIINVVIAGVIGGLAAGALEATGVVSMLIGIGVAILTAAVEVTMVVRAVRAGRRDHVPRFPPPAAPDSTPSDGTDA